MEDENDELFEHYRVVADPGQSLLRIDRFLIDRLPNFSRNKIQEGIRQEMILVNEQPVKPNYKVRPHDVVVVLFDRPVTETEIVPQDIPLNIVYEDDDLLIIYKPAGMVVHPGHANWDGTLVNALAYHFGKLPTSRNGEMKPGLVHRIDKDTSGLVVVAKTEAAMTHLAKQFFDHSIERTYYALVWGELKEETGTIEGHIGRSYSDRRVSAVFPEGEYGKPAITHYEVLKPMRYVSLVKCKLETGRTHQIRAHMKYLGHPLFGDAMYGGDKILKGERFSKYKSFVENCFKIMPRQALHAKTLGFTHPTTGERLQFDSELPEDFSTVLERWESYLQHH